MFWIIADPHISEKKEKETELFLNFLQAFKDSDAKSLVILGDLFSHFIALKKGITQFQEEIILRLKETKKELLFLSGNRDYFVEELEDSPFSFAGKRYRIKIPSSKTILFEHGETINEADRNYLAWSSISRSNAIRSLIEILPQKILKKIAERAEKRFSTTNLEFKSEIPFKYLRKYAISLSEEGVDLIVLGHFHKRLSIEFEEIKIEIVDKFFPNGFFCILTSNGEIIDKNFSDY